MWRRRDGRKSLLIGATAGQIVGMHPDRSRALLDGILAWATQPQFVLRHQWRVGDLVVWDNTGLLHRAIPYEPTSRRLMHRTTLVGEEAIAWVRSHAQRRPVTSPARFSASIAGGLPRAMARVDPLPPKEWPAEFRAAMAALRPPNPRHQPLSTEDRPKALNTLGTFAHHPELARAYFTFNGHLLLGTTLTERQRELIVLRGGCAGRASARTTRRR
ncbi:hypothetical protein MCHIJ_14100 [Mycolicibacterium chitae]|uniref:Taurine catabolism dioxygenase TauD, TfdA family protein n=1 Tax=Mycolicibacterium chitae TaxID=1792 RepID=A0A448IEL3_MYCCI|nr:hypothetical protein MCHIJ_14100 [Mycolicibacterium chitae]VEG50798.1 Taurine catabolism dioxygenase TauD, TfdA family protein [Mycolicibacterium chitae]